MHRSLPRGDICDADAVQQVVTQVLASHAHIHGVMHCAGSLSDSYLLAKSEQEFTRVLGAKVTGLLNIDRATADIALDFLVMFSSGTAINGNAGQGDYALANGFMDAFAHYRNGLTARQQRSAKHPLIGRCDRWRHECRCGRGATY